MVAVRKVTTPIVIAPVARAATAVPIARVAPRAVRALALDQVFGIPW